MIYPGSSHLDVDMSDMGGHISIPGQLQIHCVAKKDLELLVLLPVAPKSWSHRCVPPQLSLCNVEDGTQSLVHDRHVLHPPPELHPSLSWILLNHKRSWP